MSTPSSPARLHVFLAREAPVGLILRRGPSKQVCTIGWDRTNDTFQLGQWIKGRIYEHCCDLSSDGQHFLYFAANYKPSLKEGKSGPKRWTAVSRAPYLKAVAFWEHDDLDEGGGQFLGDRLTFRDNVQRGVIEGPLDLPHPSTPYLSGDGEAGIYYFRLRREGWQLLGPPASGRCTTLWTKKRNEWTLQQFARSGESPSGQSFWQRYRAHNSVSGETLGDQNWEWADFDGDRLVWAQEGKLFATRIWDGGHGDIVELADFNDWTFQAIKAPY